MNDSSEGTAMRIDLNARTPETVQSVKTGKSGSGTASSSSNSVAREDQAKLTLDRDNVRSLEAQVMNAPEIREQRVEALRRQIDSGNYHPNPEQIADAIWSEM